MVRRDEREVTVAGHQHQRLGTGSVGLHEDEVGGLPPLDLVQGRITRPGDGTNGAGMTRDGHRHLRRGHRPQKRLEPGGVDIVRIDQDLDHERHTGEVDIGGSLATVPQALPRFLVLIPHAVTLHP